MKYTKVPEDTFKTLALNGGVLLRKFTPDNAPETLPKDDFIGATTGDVTFSATPSYIDFGEDINNCPKNVAELKKLDTWDVKLSGTLVTATKKSAKSQLGAADESGDKVSPRNELKDEDFEDVWLVGDYSDKNGEKNGGFFAIHMKKALSTAGMTVTAGDKKKWTHKFEYTAHYTLKDQNTPPVEIYIHAGTEES